MEKKNKTKKAKKLKQPLSKKLADIFLADDISDTPEYLMENVVKPEARKFLFSLITTAGEKLLYGSKSPRTSSGSFGGQKIHYERGANGVIVSTPSSKSSQVTNNIPSGQGLSKYQKVVFDSNQDAKEVLAMLRNTIAEYGAVSVRDLYEEIGWDSNWNDRNMGWTNLDSADIRICRDGYLLILPKALAL